MYFAACNSLKKHLKPRIGDALQEQLTGAAHREKLHGQLGSKIIAAKPQEEERLMPAAISCSGAAADPFHGIQLRDPTMGSLLSARKAGSR